jgi:hypothetical protein
MRTMWEDETRCEINRIYTVLSVKEHYVLIALRRQYGFDNVANMIRSVSMTLGTSFAIATIKILTSNACIGDK